MTSAVHIVAVGARTPVGLSAESSAAAVRANVSRLREHPFAVDTQGGKVRCGLDGVLLCEQQGVERLVALAGAALEEVATQLGRRSPAPLEVPVFLALPEPRPGHSVADAEHLARALTAWPLPGTPALHVRRAGEGHAGALAALEVGARDILAGRTELCLVAAVDSYIGAGTLPWLDSERRLAREGIRSGFPPGEAACVLALASDAMIERLGLASLARVRAVATTLDPSPADADAGLLGHGLTEVVRRVGAVLRPGERIDAIYCDINGERQRADEWGFTLLRTASLFCDATCYTTAVGELGDTGAATGALGCTWAVRAWQRGYAKGALALVWGSSWGGLRAAALLEAPGS